MNIIGINHGHNSSIGVAVNDEIVFAINEERLRRIKNYFGLPTMSLEYCYKIFIIKKDVDYFVFYHNTFNDFFMASYYGADENLTKYEILRRRIMRKLTRFLNPVFIKTIFYYSEYIFFPESVRRRYFSKKLDIPREKIIFANHHLCHAQSAAYSLDKKKDWLIFTSDGEGDMECASVYKKEKHSDNLIKLTSIHRNHSLGYFFLFITQYLGMKPNEHEYKVMGLEPYARKNTVEYQRVYKKFSGLFYFKNMDFRSRICTISRKYYSHWLPKMMQYERFDYIGAAAQKIIESISIQWIENWIEKTGISNVALAGGVFMNVKLNQRIYELPNVEDLFVVPSAGDETTVFGACNIVNCEKNNRPLKRLRDLYLGNEFTDEEIEEFVENQIDLRKYKVIFYGSNLEKEVAGLLAKGIIVARFNGRLEFGARALGNRSILAHPKDRRTIKQINELIKDRDFWMPFTPSVLEEDAGKYVLNPKNIYAPYMAITFNSSKLAKKQLSAAIHPYDETVRVQMVSRKWNSSYHALISHFKKLTNIGGILNTSFNLHGMPNVCYLSDTIFTLENSGLTHLALGRYLINKRT